MHNRNHYPIISFLFIFVTTFFMSVAMAPSAQAQDLIARQAPVDRKLKSVDSVALSRVLNRHKVVNYETGNLYSSWDTEHVHCYKDVRLPDTYRVDLRGFCMPTPSKVVTSNYGYRATFGRMHKGIDVKVYIGDTIVSAFDGKVRIVKYDAGGYGKYVVIRHDNGLETIYGHLSKQLVQVGDVVRAGEPIGLGGNTGRSTGSHLHFETRLLGEAINPAEMFDFVAQDVTCDFYDYHHSGDFSSPATALAETNEPAVETANGEVAVVNEEAVETNEKVSKRSKKNKKNAEQGKVYKIRKGDSLYSISKKVGVSIDQLCSRNNISTKSKLQLGQILRY